MKTLKKKKKNSRCISINVDSFYFYLVGVRLQLYMVKIKNSKINFVAQKLLKYCEIKRIIRLTIQLTHKK